MKKSSKSFTAILSTVVILFFASGFVSAQDDLDILHHGAATIVKLAGTMGILQNHAVQYIEAKQQKILNELDIDISTINVLIEERNKARSEKNWEKADEIRNRLLDMRIEIKDETEGTTWQVKI